MELTKQDKKHISDEVSRLAFRISVESHEYARLYEREYLTALIQRVQQRIDCIDDLERAAMKASESK